METIVASIVLEGLKLWSEERRTRFMDEHHELIQDLRKAENDQTSNYSDAAIDLAEEALQDFYKAYHAELKKETSK